MGAQAHGNRGRSVISASASGVASDLTTQAGGLKYDPPAPM